MAKGPCLDDLFVQARCLSVDGLPPRSVMLDIIRIHGALAHCISKKYARQLSPLERLSYMWEALPIAITEWDPSKGKAGTALTLVFNRLVSRHNEHHSYRGAVRVPPKRLPNFSGLSVSGPESEMTILQGIEYAEAFTD